MTKKYPKSESLPKYDPSEEMYVFWNKDDSDSWASAQAAMTDAVQEYTSATRYRQDLSNLATNTSGRPGLTREEYGMFRPDESLPTKTADILISADKIYKKNGMIRNIMDLMSDFGSQGIRLSHPNKRIEKFYRNWWKRVNGIERSERFLSYLYRLSNVVVRRQTARLNASKKERLFKSFAAPDVDAEFLEVKRNEIPWKYTFYHPATVQVLGEELSSFNTDPQYAIKLSRKLKKMIMNPSPEEAKILKDVPQEIKDAARTNKAVLLPSDKVEVFFYKKDDWEVWAVPIIYAIMQDVILLNKLKLADIAALDGAISNIRIFKLGNIEAGIAPTRAAASKLAEILENHMGAGTMDLVWGPDIELVESKTSVHQFLGEEKYKPTLNAIYAGLGIPPTLTGTTGSSGTTNNFMSLKTLVKRLEYGRNRLCEFWQKEIEMVQKAMGFRFPATIEFDYMDLGDEAAEKALLIQMVDRNLISEELFQRRFGHNTDIEDIRIRRDHREREDGKKPPKASAFHDPQIDVALKKIALQSGVSTPSEVGLELEPRKSGEKPALMMKQPTGPPGSKKKGQPGQGRPKNKKDSTKRKTKQFKPKSKASLDIWTYDTQDKIAEIVNPAVLQMYSKKNMRSLSNTETEMAELLKFSVLCSLEPLSEFSDNDVITALNQPLNSEVKNMYVSLLEEVSSELGRKLTLQDKRYLQAKIYYILQELDDG